MLFPYGKRRHIWIYGQKSTGKTAIVESTIQDGVKMCIGPTDGWW